MKRILLPLLPIMMFATGIAAADSGTHSIELLAKIARAQASVPVEWDGIWTTQDTVYTCPSTFQSTSVGSDTLCGGSEYNVTGPGGIVFTCTGTADATTIDVTCTGSGELFPGCNGDFTVTTKGTRTNDTYFIVSTVNVAYTGALCIGLPSCDQINTHGTRTGPTMTGDCAVTPTKQSTWGQLKVIYR
jgi:hypothetical protein